MIGFRQRSRAVFRWLLRLLVGRKFSSSLEQNRAAADRLDEVMRELLRQ